MFELGDRRPGPNCPCQDQKQHRCATCQWANPPGHPRSQHRGFLRVVDFHGSWQLCTLCAAIAVAQAAEWATFDITLLLDATLCAAITPPT